MNEKLKLRLMKLLALSESSNKHEASNAQRRIEALCAKHNVAIEDLISEDEKVSTYWFRYDCKLTKSVLINTVWKATNISTMYRSGARQRQVGVECTKSQAAEIELWWSVMRAAFKQHLEDTTKAFIQANDLYGEAEESDHNGSDIDWDALARQQALAARITPTPVNKGITHEK